MEVRSAVAVGPVSSDCAINIGYICRLNYFAVVAVGSVWGGRIDQQL